MKFVIAILLLSLLAQTCSGGSQEEGEPYSIEIVRIELQMRSRGIFHGWSTRNLTSLGDRVSIALIKILNQQELMNPETIENYLPMIRDSFSHPENMSLESDRQPNVTALLLDHLLQNVSVAQTRIHIQQASDFVRAKAPRQ